MYKSLNISQDIGLNADRNKYSLDLFQSTCIFFPIAIIQIVNLLN